MGATCGGGLGSHSTMLLDTDTPNVVGALMRPDHGQMGLLWLRMMM